MSFCASPSRNFRTWEFINGNIHKNMSIMVDRWRHLQQLSKMGELTIALRDPHSGAWTKWTKNIGEHLIEIEGRRGFKNWRLSAAIDVHRKILPNEIIIESDYPQYNQNYEAAKIIGIILEKKGFIPHYYYSGGKSIHLHIFFDWNCLKSVDGLLQEQIRVKFNNSLLRFKKAFILWLREKMISCWDLNLREFDKDLIKSTHLIRMVFGKNRLGYKTFLGYSHKDLSFVPYVCNEENRIYPKLGKIKLSRPHNPQELIEEFISHLESKTRIGKIRRRNWSLKQWMPKEKEELRPCVKFILSEDFRLIGDGYRRAMFILVNDLKKVWTIDQARVIIGTWNSLLGKPIKQQDIELRLSRKNYSLSCDYIHSFLSGLGINISQKCKGKV